MKAIVKGGSLLCCRRAIVRALFVRQDLAELEKLLEKEKNPAVRHDIELALAATQVHPEYLTRGSGQQ